MRMRLTDREDRGGPGKLAQHQRNQNESRPLPLTRGGRTLELSEG